MCLEHHDGLRGSIVRRRYTYADISELGTIGARLLVLPELSVYQVQVGVAHLGAKLLEFDPPYEKVILVPTEDDNASPPNALPQLAGISREAVATVRNFAHHYLSQYTPVERVHLNYHTNFHHHDIPAMRVASPYGALQGFMALHDGPVPLASRMDVVKGAYVACMETGDSDNFDWLAHVSQIDRFHIFSDLEPHDILGAYIGEVACVDT